MWVINPETARPIRMGSRVYNSLVRRGVLCPDDMLKSPDEMAPPLHPPKLVRSRKIYRQLEDIEEDDEEKEEVKEEVKEDLMQRVAQCAADTVKDASQYEGLSEDELKNQLEELIIKALTSSSSSS